MPLELRQQKRGAFRTPALMSNRVLHNNFVQDGAVVQGDEEGVPDGPFGGLVVVYGELGVFDAVDLGAEGVDARVGGGCVGADLQKIEMGQERGDGEE